MKYRPIRNHALTVGASAVASGRFGDGIHTVRVWAENDAHMKLVDVKQSAITGMTDENPVVATVPDHEFLLLDVVTITGVVGMTDVNDEDYRVVVNDASTVTLVDAETDLAITAITKADPAVVTSAAHGLSNGDVVYIDNVVGMPEVNGRFFTVANVASDTFELADEDSSEYGTYVSGGIAIEAVDGSGFTEYTSGGLMTWESGVATTSDMVIAEGWPEYFTVSPGQKVSLLQETAGGEATVTEMSQ